MAAVPAGWMRHDEHGVLPTYRRGEWQIDKCAGRGFDLFRENGEEFVRHFPTLKEAVAYAEAEDLDDQGDEKVKKPKRWRSIDDE